MLPYGFVGVPPDLLPLTACYDYSVIYFIYLFLLCMFLGFITCFCSISCSFLCIYVNACPAILFLFLIYPA